VISVEAAFQIGEAAATTRQVAHVTAGFIVGSAETADGAVEAPGASWYSVERPCEKHLHIFGEPV